MVIPTADPQGPDASIRVLREGGCTTILLDRPHVLNAIDAPMHFALEAAFDAFQNDPSQRICVIRGAGGRAFCAGSDLKYAARMKAEGREGELAYPPHGYAGLIERFDLAKPVIAVVDGVALGGGFEIVLACDLVIATPCSRFGLPEPRIGSVALGGGLHRLARQIGLKQAMAMALTAEPVDAEEGYRLGFVNEVVAADGIDEAIARWVGKIAKGAPGAIAATKQMILRGLDEPSLADAIRGQRSYDAYVTWRGSDELWEGARSFAEKRAPAWLEE